jgi:uncharacterized GH25 family protein
MPLVVARWCAVFGLIACGLIVCVGTVADAHELKAFASKLAVDRPSVKTTVYLSWGERIPVDDLIDGATLERYELLAPDGKVTPLKTTGVSLQTNVAELRSTGLHEIVAVKKPSVYTFYFDKNGKRLLKLGPRTEIKEGRIDYAGRSVQSAKAFIVVGSCKQPPKPAGLPMEIVPLDPPSQWTNGASLHFQVLLEDKPISYVNVLARYVGFTPDDAWCYATDTNRQGIAHIRPSHPGTWVILVHYKRPTSGPIHDQYDFDSFVTTLTFEVSGGTPPAADQGLIDSRTQETASLHP